MAARFGVVAAAFVAGSAVAVWVAYWFVGRYLP